MLTPTFSTARPLAITVFAAAWGSALFGATQLHKLDLPLGHGICGPWGCAAEPEALLGYHVFWLALLTPAIGLVVRAMGPQKGPTVALWLTMLGALGFLGTVGVAALGWLREGNEPQYAIQRGLFVVATMPDLPSVPLLFAGGLARLVGRLSQRPR